MLNENLIGVLIGFLFLLLNPFQGVSQYQFSIDVSEDNHEISPYIYGLSYKHYPYAKATSLNGSRMTTFNWETNVSNGGFYQSNGNDLFMPWITGVDQEVFGEPGITISNFQKYCDENKLFSAIVVPMAGFVAKDTTCKQSNIAPSDCWIEVKNEKDPPTVFPPDLEDNVVYNEEMIQFLVDSFGSDGVDAYFLDNEPGLWYYDYPHVVGLEIDDNNTNNLSYELLLEKSLALAKTIKNINPDAKVFGPALWSFKAQTDLQNATDAEANSGYNLFSDYYLDKFQEEEIKTGVNLLDVFDFHWYPEYDIRSDDVTTIIANNRMQSPRTLWDPTYVDPSWMSVYGPMQVLRTIKSSIETYNQGKAISVSEYFYGAPYDISGGIAQADALGIFGREDVYYASLFWPKWVHNPENKEDLDGYIKSAFDIYLNYDGDGGSFGSKSVKAVMADEDVEDCSIYASIDEETGDLHVVAVNKNSTVGGSLANFSIDHYNAIQEVEMYYFNESSELIQSKMIEVDDISDFSLELDPKSVIHLVFHADPNGILDEGVMEDWIEVFPNPCIGQQFRIVNKSSEEVVEIRLFDLMGNQVPVEMEDDNGLMIENIPTGSYILQVQFEDKTVIKRLVSLKK